jgi:hypothetical protein
MDAIRNVAQQDHDTHCSDTLISDYNTARGNAAASVSQGSDAAEF